MLAPALSILQHILGLVSLLKQFLIKCISDASPSQNCMLVATSSGKTVALGWCVTPSSILLAGVTPWLMWPLYCNPRTLADVSPVTSLPFLDRIQFSPNRVTNEVDYRLKVFTGKWTGYFGLWQLVACWSCAACLLYSGAGGFWRKVWGCAAGWAGHQQGRDGQGRWEVRNGRWQVKSKRW